MAKDSKLIKKSAKWSTTWGTTILAFATVILASATVALVVSTVGYAKDIKMAFEYYSSERTMGLLWDEYKYDRALFLLEKSDVSPILKKDLDMIYLELWKAEDQLRYYRYLPDENYKRIRDALNGFTNDFPEIVE